MTTKEVSERLSKEFPGRTICFTVNCWSGCGPNDPVVRIYDSNPPTSIDCNDLEDGIAKMKNHLAPSKTNMCEVPS